MNQNFDEIRHYNKEETEIAIKKLFQDTTFASFLNMFKNQLNIERIYKEHSTYKTVKDFQLNIAKGVVKYFIDTTTTGVELRGLENIKDGEPHLFIANHRDIVFDAALLQYYFFINDFTSSKIAVGDNLFTEYLFELFGKINKMITVKRSVTVRDKLNQFKLLSEYLHYSIQEEKDSVWIAGRNGRTKNGYDETQQGFVKMLTMTDPKYPLKAIKQLDIVPVTISYELESCDNLKARELILSENRVYQKQADEDFESIKQGLFGQKGNVNLTIGKPINDLIADMEEDNPKVIIKKICDLLDDQNRLNYVLYASNYIAYDILEKDKKYENKYTEEEKENFLQYLQKQSIVNDVSYESMFNALLQIYANSVKMCNKSVIY